MGKTTAEAAGMITFRRMLPEDAAGVEVVERACFSMPWSRESFWEEAASEKAYYLLALAGEKLIGRAMMCRLIEIVRKLGATAMTLEVRPSNAAAVTLYEKLGFKSAGLRPGYYEDNGEAAMIMWLTNL